MSSLPASLLPSAIPGAIDTSMEREKGVKKSSLAYTTPASKSQKIAREKEKERAKERTKESEKQRRAKEKEIEKRVDEVNYWKEKYKKKKREYQELEQRFEEFQVESGDLEEHLEAELERTEQTLLQLTAEAMRQQRQDNDGALSMYQRISQAAIRLDEAYALQRSALEKLHSIPSPPPSYVELRDLPDPPLELN